MTKAPQWFGMFSLAIAVSLSMALFQHARAAISYSTEGGLYTEGFDSLPTDPPSNANIETLYTDGWRDDTTTVTGSHISVPGWYVRHPLSPAAENGSNGFQRFRYGPGANTGAFWAFGSVSTDPEKALGSIGSTTVAGNGANMYMALRLTNATGATLSSFTLTYDGEQWRDGQAATGETLSFDFSLTATDLDWFDPATSFTAVPGLNYTSPVVAGVGTAGTAVNGNIEGRVPDRTATISGIAWAPGTDLWLRWGDPQLAGNADDGLAIDNVRFVAVPEPASCLIAGLGAMVAFARRRL